MADRASFEKLNNQNYMNWALRMRMFLIKEGLWSVVSNIEVAENVENQEDGQKALAFICLNIEDNQLGHVENAVDGRDAWNVLRTYHQRNTVGNKIRLLSRLFRTHMVSSESMEDHLSKMTQILSELTAIGAGIDEPVAVCAIIRSVIEEYESLVTAIEAWEDERLTIGNVKAKLLEEFDRKKERQETETAFVVTVGDRPPLAKRMKRKPYFECYFCGKPDHLKRDCEVYKIHLKEKQDKENKDSARMARFNSWYSDWCFDSGASCHMCNQVDKFENFSETERKEILLADGGSVISQGKGTVKLRIMIEGNRSVNVTISDVLFVPELDENLISVSKMTNKEFDVLFSGKQCFLIKGNERFLVAEFHNGLYRVLSQPCEQSRTVVERRAHCIHQWHRIFAHRNLSDISMMGRQGLAIRKCQCEFNCEPCLKGKMSRKPFYQSKNRATKILQCVATDLGGPLQVKSLGQSLYYITFTDLFSGYCEVVPIKSKDKATIMVKRYIEKMKNMTGKTVKIFRSDRGTEYMNKNLQDYLADQGIKFQCTTGYAPEQNGVAERQNRTLMEAARTILADSGLPKTYWAEAVKYVAFVNNRIINKRNGKTPLELMFGVKANYDDMYSFGSEVYVHVPKQKRRKLDDKAKRGIYVGHDELSKGYRIADPKSHKISVSRDVIFMKGKLLIPNNNLIDFNFKQKNKDDDDDDEDDDGWETEDSEDDDRLTIQTIRD